MKKATTVRDSLYKVLDGLIGACKSMNRDIPTITLTIPQFNVFKQFNEPTEGNYYYRGIVVKSL